ncbi:thiamine-phosphate kinase [Demetria terragena]|uniref:thiamine-phosphate kinase n=1 Tax=Demetria terragena TaxID=63959 RepID=UPI0003789CD5|nr:thiamine-phosphate kinase [Demetria terragena]
MSDHEPTKRRLADLSEDDLLAEIFPLLPTSPQTVIGPGDDTALVSSAGGRVLATTDTMVRGRDWLDEWSSGADVGAKAVAQNVADIAAMGGQATGLLVTLVADPQTPLEWVLDMARGLGEAARAIDVAVLGGDLSSAPEGVLMVSVTALGELDGDPVLRSGARVGDVIAVAGTLGRSAAGLALLQQGRGGEAPDLVAFHCRPRPPFEQGPEARQAGATAMLDLSDGLIRDAGRIAKSSGVCLAFRTAALSADVQRLAPSVGQSAALESVLTGGEEHSLLACFGPSVPLPQGWRIVGDVVEGEGVTVDGKARSRGGWDHFTP